MKSMLLGGVAVLTLGMSGALAQSTTTPAASPSPDAAASASATSGQFIENQAPGLLRAPKIVGVAVYDNQNKSVGKIDDLLLDKDGSVKAVVIGIGGFLGIGKKDVAVPYNAIHWQTEARTVATNDAPAANNNLGGTSPANSANTNAANTNSMTGTTATGNAANGAANATQKIDPAKTEAYQGYPDRAVIDMSQDQLKSAPDFKYASNPASMSNGANGAATTNGTTTTK